MSKCPQPGQLNQNNLPVVPVWLHNPTGVYAIFDVLVKLPVICNRIMFGTICQYNNYPASPTPVGPPASGAIGGLWVHLTPSGYNSNPPAAAWYATGTEPWITLLTQNSNNQSPASLQGMSIEFEYPINQFYISASFNATNYNIGLSIICADSVKVLWQPRD